MSAPSSDLAAFFLGVFFFFVEEAAEARLTWEAERDPAREREREERGASTDFSLSTGRPRDLDEETDAERCLVFFFTGDEVGDFVVAFVEYLPCFLRLGGSLT